VTAPSGSDRRRARLLVIGQFALLTELAALPRRADWPVPVGLRRVGNAAVAAGLALSLGGASALGPGLTALPLPSERAALRTGGVYRWVRHPIYSGILLAAVARAVTSGNRWSIPVAVTLAVLLREKARFEEHHLAVRFAGYPDYAARTPRFVPGLPPPRR
jgi:protein-S-isoprenylcysteine O-methyltransferase Ste14